MTTRFTHQVVVIGIGLEAGFLRLAPKNLCRKAKARYDQ